MKISFQRVEYNSSLYHQLLPLREKILRTPIGLSYTPEDIKKEAGQIHIAAFYENEPAASLLMKSLNQNEIKIRQVAVYEGFQARGIGYLLMIHAEKEALQLGFKSIVMHARQSVSEFYRKLGYQERGSVFKEVGIDHIKMEKSLTVEP